MLPVEQTIPRGPLANCFPACIASVLECPLGDVPHPTAAEGASFEAWQDYMVRLNGWLAERNLVLLPLTLEEGFIPAGYALLGAVSPRTGGLHSVVALDGAVVWDPHPARDAGVGEWRDWHVFAVLDPTRPVGCPG